MFTKAAYVVALTGALFGGAAFAEQHEVEFVEGGFFPPIVYLSAGDTVVFTNYTENTQKVQAADLSWHSGYLGVNSSYVLSVSQYTQLNFHNAYDTEKTGELSFTAAPLN